MNPVTSHPAPRDTLLRISEVLKRIPVSRTSLYDGIKIGLYPAPVRIGKRSVAWWESEINAAINGFRN
jgi:prophage regulatory protein